MGPGYGPRTVFGPQNAAPDPVFAPRTPSMRSWGLAFGRFRRFFDVYLYILGHLGICWVHFSTSWSPVWGFGAVDQVLGAFWAPRRPSEGFWGILRGVF